MAASLGEAAEGQTDFALSRTNVARREEEAMNTALKSIVLALCGLLLIEKETV